MGLCNSKSAAGRGGSRTTSPIISETKTGSLTMHIAGCSQTKGIGVGKSITSSTFDVGGHSWCILYFPDGDNQDAAGWISVFLCLVTPAAAADVVTAAFQFSLLDGDPQYPQVFASTPSAEWTFSMVDGYSPNREFSKLIRRKNLKRHLGRKAFRIRCDVTVLRTASASPPPLTAEVPLAASELHCHLGDILATGDGADVCFMVAGKPFLAHRSVVAARSSVLKEELFGPGKETAGISIQVNNMKPSVFRAVLHFFYTDALPDIEEGDRRPMAQGLLVAAERFDIERLKLMSEDMLCKGLDGETVASTLQLAEKYGCLGLKKAYLMFIKSTPLHLLGCGHAD